MPGRVEQDPDVFLRLVASQSGADLLRPGHSRLKIVDGDVQVHHHLRLAGRRRPRGRPVTRL